MKIKNKDYKNLLFFLLLMISIAYISLLTILTKDLLQSCVVKLAEIMSITQTGEFFYAVLSVPEFFVNSIGLIVVLYLFVKIILAVLGVTIDFIKTSEFVAALIKKNKGEFIELNTNKNYLFTHGILNPKIYISKGALKKLSRRERDSVILHEKFHSISFDPAKELFMRVLKNSIPSIFLLKNLIEKYNSLTELAADEYSCEIVGTNKHIISSLIKIFTTNMNKNLTFKSFAGETDRVRFLTNKGNLALGKTFIAVVFSITLMAVSTVSVSATRPFNQCKNYDSCYSQEVSEKNSSDLEKCVLIEYVNGSFERMSKDFSN